jgi:F-type H+-transporting ATPase subunit b
MSELLHEPEFWVAVAFVIFVALAGKKIYEAIGKLLDERAARIRAELGEAERLRAEAEKLLAEYQRKQREAIKDAEAILSAAREEAARLRKEAAANLEAHVKRRERAAVEQIAQAEAHAVAEVRNQAIELAVGAARAALAESLDAARAGALIDRSLADLEKRLH